MRNRWPIFVALTASSLSVLATGVTAGFAFSFGTQPAALALGLFGTVAASIGLLAIVRWMLAADDAYPDYRYRRAVAAGPAAFAAALQARDTVRPVVARRPLPARPETPGDNVIVFDPARARHKQRQAL